VSRRASFRVDNDLRCSFCRKGQSAAGKLISNASDYPRAYICDECISVCHSIIEDDRLESSSDPEPETEAQDALLSKFLVAAKNWIRAEAAGWPDTAERFAEMRTLAEQVFVEPHTSTADSR
jgi:hypothetical protein